ncbi:MAG TPA: hydantoinase B/oxoprolinase family protein [Thermohalobaculum sp.]|nr:hydantoinase B/oxoprolinase family protein [Thermohalobaculum sp.]
MTLSPVAMQVMWNRLIAVVEEQARALIRTAFSTSVREAGDLSAGVYDLEGRMLAQAVTGTPGHVNAMAESVGHFMRAIGPGNMRAGDVYLTNDPWKGTGHLHDITVVTPAFHRGAHVGYLACTAHVVDIGGRGFGADAGSVYEEGLRIPIMPFARAGAVNRDLVAMVRANVREPDQVVGDIYALAACNETGHRRLVDMLDEFGLAGLEDVAAFILEHSRRATIERIAALPRATALSEMTIDGYATPIRLAVRLEIHADRIVADFAGSSPEDAHGINVPLVYTRAYACYGLKCALAPEIPNNAASLAPFEVTAPEGCILNAADPAPVALRHVIGHMVPDTVLGALHKVLPGTVPAEGAGALCNFHLSFRPRRDGTAPADARRAEVLMFNCGGAGARPRFDGLNATAFPSGVMTMPVEATEHTGPIVIWQKELRPDSGGPGRRRGGLGQLMRIGALEGHEFVFSAMFDRMQHPARGREGGGAGGATRFALDDGTPMRAKGWQPVPPGHTVQLALPGGGGYGPPAERDPVLLKRDVALGYVSRAAALRDYGASPDDLPEDEA